MKMLEKSSDIEQKLSLITMSLREAVITTINKISFTKNSTIRLSLEGVKPKDLMMFMKEHKIPETAVFSFLSSEERFDTDELFLSWEVEVKNYDKEKEMSELFNKITVNTITNTMRMNGFTFSPCYNENKTKLKDKDLWSLFKDEKLFNNSDVEVDQLLFNMFISVNQRVILRFDN